MKNVQAYRAMVHFLEDRYGRVPSDALGGLLGELALQQDGLPADPAVVADWKRALDQSANSEPHLPAVTPIHRKVS